MIATVLRNVLFKSRVPILAHKNLEKFQDELKLLNKKKSELKSKLNAQVSELVSLEAKVNTKWNTKYYHNVQNIYISKMNLFKLTMLNTKELRN